MRKTSFDIRPEFCVAAAAAFLLLPFKLTVAWLTAALVHECFHYLAIRLTGTEVHRVCIGLNGTVMETETMTSGKEFLCALAGPAGGFLLLFFIKRFPLLAVCGCIQSIYNLLPLFPLDGGRALQCLLYRLIPEKSATRLFIIIEKVVLALVVIAALYLAFRLLLGPLPILCAGILLFKTKISCKPVRQ